MVPARAGRSALTRPPAWAMLAPGEREEAIVIGTVTIRTHAGAGECPVRGRIDQERCLSCTWLVSARPDGEDLTIRCRASWPVLLMADHRSGMPYLDPLP